MECEFAFDLKADNVCVNPYHYIRDVSQGPLAFDLGSLSNTQSSNVQCNPQPHTSDGYMLPPQVFNNGNGNLHSSNMLQQGNNFSQQYDNRFMGYHHQEPSRWLDYNNGRQQSAHHQTQCNTITYAANGEQANNGDNASYDKPYSNIHSPYQYPSITNYQEGSMVDNRYIPKTSISDSNQYSHNISKIATEGGHNTNDKTFDKSKYTENKEKQTVTAINPSGKDAGDKETTKPIKSEEGLSELSLSHNQALAQHDISNNQTNNASIEKSTSWHHHTQASNATQSNSVKAQNEHIPNTSQPNYGQQQDRKLPVSRSPMPEFWCSISYFELGEQVSIIH